jgi:hypothetical protein
MGVEAFERVHILQAAFFGIRRADTRIVSYDRGRGCW